MLYQRYSVVLVFESSRFCHLWCLACTRQHTGTHTPPFRNFSASRCKLDVSKASCTGMRLSKQEIRSASRSFEFLLLGFPLDSFHLSYKICTQTHCRSQWAFSVCVIGVLSTKAFSFCLRSSGACLCSICQHF